MSDPFRQISLRRLEGMEADGWRVTFLGADTPVDTLEAAVRRLAVRWRLAGGNREAFGELVGRVADEVFRPVPRAVFLECNPIDLDRGLEQLGRETTVQAAPLLLAEAGADPGRLAGVDVLFTPYFHLAEARELVLPGVQVVPLNFVPSEETMRTLVDVPADALERASAFHGALTTAESATSCCRARTIPPSVRAAPASTAAARR